MQKRLLALVATVAMVLSMFAGTVFAADRAIIDLQWNGPLSSVEVKDGVIYTYADYTTVKKVVNGVGTIGKWIGIGIEKPADDSITGYYYTTGGGASGYSTLDNIKGKQGLEWGMDIDGITTKTITLAWVDEGKTQVGDIEEYEWRYVDTRLKQASPIYTVGGVKYVDVQVLEDGEVANIRNYEFNKAYNYINSTTAQVELPDTGDVDVFAIRVGGTEVAKIVVKQTSAPVGDVKVEVALDETMYYQNEKASQVITITGEIVDEDGDLVEKHIPITVAGLDTAGDPFEEKDVARYGKISYELPGNAAIGDYVIKITPGHGYEDLNNDGVKFTVLASEVITDDSFAFDWSDKGTFEYSARLPLGVNPKRVQLKDLTGVIADSSTPSKVSIFGRWVEVKVPKADFMSPGKLELQYSLESGGDKWVTFATGKINKVDVSSRFSISPEAIIYGIGKQDIKAVLDIGVGDSKLHIPAGSKYGFNLGSLVGKASNPKIVSDPDYVFTYDFTSANYGTYTAKAVVLVNGQVAYEATKTLTVDNPGVTNVLGVPEEFAVADGLKFAPQLYYENDDGKLVAASRFEITYSGPGLDEGSKKVNRGDFFELKVQQAGIYTLEIEAFDANGKSVATETVEVKATGATMIIEPAKVEMKQAETVVITLKNQDDKPINNANLLFKNGDTPVASYTAAKLNPNNGVYEIELKADSKLVQNAADLTVVAEVADKKVVEGKFAVVGKSVYDVSTDLTKDILAGQKTKVNVSVTKDGKVVYPYEFVVFNAKGERVSGPSYTRSGDNCVINLTINKDGEYTLVARNRDLSEIGETTFTVVKPVLELSVDNLTNNVKSAFVAKLVDPTDDNKVLKWNMKIAPEYARLLGLELDGKKINVGSSVTLGKLEEYKLNVLMHTDYKAAEKAEKVAGLKFTVVGNGTVVIDDVMPIADAELISDPAEPVVGQSGKLTLKLVDANEAPLAGHKVFRGDNEIGTTDENGEVVYRGRMTDTMTFAANLAKVDSKVQTVEVTVTPVDDDEAPVLGEIPEKTDKATFELVITDNVKVTKVYIDGEEQLFVPGAEVKIPLNLKLGKNTFRVMALDAADNGIDETITIVYAPAGVKLTIGKTEYVANGETKTMEAAPYLKGDHTMIPVRALETFGVKYAWDQDTKTATFELDENVVKVTVGSTTAVVNGEQAAVPVAPEIVNNRTMAPLRFVLQNLGLKVHWVPGGEITITR